MQRTRATAITATGLRCALPRRSSLDRREEGLMKLVIAVIKPQQLDVVREALTLIGVRAMTVTEVKGYGRQKGHMEIYRGAEYVVDFLPKLRIDVAIGSEQLAQVVNAIAAAAKTGRPGYRKLFVTPLEPCLFVLARQTATSFRCTSMKLTMSFPCFVLR